MPTFRYSKLVRDNIRQLHEANGDIVDGKTLSKDELVSALLEKLSEESSELASAIASNDSGDIASELADLYQVLEDMASVLGIDEDAIKTVKTKKHKKKGGFLQGQYIDTVTIVHEDDPLILGFRSNPDKYPEIS